MRNYSEFMIKLRQAILKRYEQGKPRLIYSDMEKLGKQYDISVAEADSARKQTEKAIMQESINVANTDNKIMNSDGAFAQMQGKINRDVKRVVDRGIKNKYSTSDIEKMLNRTLNKGKRISRTITRTARNAKIRSDYLKLHIAAGCKHFRYAGPSSGARSFCSYHFGKIYTIEQIYSLDNGQGLPVLLYMGGWNCRHRWEAVYDYKPPVQTPKGESVTVAGIKLATGAKPKPHEKVTAQILVDNDNQDAKLLIWRKELEELDKYELRWKPKDLRSDIIKHKKGLKIETDEQYEKEAIDIVKQKPNPHIKYYKGEEQFCFFADKGFVICDKDGTIRGYYHSRNINKVIEHYTGEGSCIKI